MGFGDKPEKKLVSLDEAVRVAAESIVAEVGLEGNGRTVVLSNFGDNGSRFQKALATAGYVPEVLFEGQSEADADENYEVNVTYLIHRYRFG